MSKHSFSLIFHFNVKPFLVRGLCLPLCSAAGEGKAAGEKDCTSLEEDIAAGPEASPASEEGNKAGSKAASTL